jgi:hypothetical protein
MRATRRKATLLGLVGLCAGLARPRAIEAAGLTDTRSGTLARP